MRAARLGRVHRVVDGEDDQLLAVELKGLHKDGHLGLVDQLQELRHLGGDETDLVGVVQLGQVEVGQVETWMREVDMSSLDTGSLVENPHFDHQKFRNLFSKQYRFISHR